MTGSGQLVPLVRVGRFRKYVEMRATLAGRPRCNSLARGGSLGHCSLTLAPSFGEEVIPIEVHDLVPGCHEVTHESLLPVITGVDLGDCTKLRVRPKNEVRGRGGPLDLARSTISSFVGVLGGCRRPPCRAGIEQVHEEVVSQRSRL